MSEAKCIICGTTKELFDLELDAEHTAKACLRDLRAARVHLCEERAAELTAGEATKEDV
jgi:hypothetical protein